MSAAVAADSPRWPHARSGYALCSLIASTHADALVIAAYLKSLKPVANAVGGPVGPNDKPKIFDVLPAAVYNALPTPPIPTK